MRKYKRFLAHANMKRAGLSRVNKGDFFAKNWRDYLRK